MPADRASTRFVIRRRAARRDAPLPVEPPRPLVRPSLTFPAWHLSGRTTRFVLRRRVTSGS